MIKLLVIVPTPRVFGLQVATLAFFKNLDKDRFSPFFLISKWNDGDFVERLKELGLPYDFVYLGFLSKQLTWRNIDMTLTCLFHLPGVFWDLGRLMKKHHFDVVYISGYHLVIQVFPLLLLWRNPVVCHVHDYYANTTFHKLLYRLLDRAITRYIAVSQSIRLRLISLGINPDKIDVLYSSVDLSRFDSAEPSKDVIRKRFGWPASVAIIGFVGQIIERKGVVDFVLSAKKVCGQHENVKFVIVGKADGEHYLEVKKLVETLGLEDLVHFWGYENAANIPDIFRSIDILVMPSRGEEAFGLVVAEAMAAGKPVVVTRSEVTTELVSSDEEGIVVEKDDPEALAEGISFLIRNAAVAKAMGQAGRRKIEEMCTVDKQVALFEKFITQLAQPASIDNPP